MQEHTRTPVFQETDGMVTSDQKRKSSYLYH